MSEKNFLIKYGESQINMFSDEKNDYLNLADIARSFNLDRKSIGKWLQNKQTIDFLCAWEKKNNPEFADPKLGVSPIKPRTFSVKEWIEVTGAIGIFSRVRGSNPGTWAHKDIAIRFGGWISSDFELWLVEEIQRLKKIEEQKYSYELLDHKQVLFLVQLKEVFKYVVHQVKIEDAHKEVFAAKSGSKNPFADFNTWRNKILDLSVNVINQRIEDYCNANDIPITKNLLKKTKREKLLLLDSYESVRNAVWDFLSIKGEANALNLANLVKDMIRTEKGEVLFKNETDLFHTKQDLGAFNDFIEKVDNIPLVKTAREVLALREKSKQWKDLPDKKTTKFDNTLKGLLAVPKPPKEKP